MKYAGRKKTGTGPLKKVIATVKKWVKTFGWRKQKWCNQTISLITPLLLTKLFSVALLSGPTR
jgi:hypothetical protein